MSEAALCIPQLHVGIIGAYVGAFAAKSQTDLPNAAIGSTIVFVVFDAQSADITAIQRITTQNISTISFQITDFSDSPSP